MGDHRLRFAVDLSPPKVGTEPSPNNAATVAVAQLAKAGDSCRAAFAVDDQEVELFAALALPGATLDVLARLLDVGVRAPREPARHLRVAGEREQRFGVARLGRAQSQTRADQ